MIYSKDRRFQFATSNYREHIDPALGITHVSVDFYAQSLLDNREWVLYHNGIKNLYKISSETINLDAQRGSWIRLRAILINDDKSREYVKTFEAEAHRRDEEIRQEQIAERQRVYQARMREEEEDMVRRHAEMLRQQDQNNRVVENISSGNIPSETKVPPIVNTSAERDFSNLIVDE